MSRVGELLRDAAQAGLRLVPWPTEPGLRQVGHPDETSPVVLTGNYDLTVRRVMRALPSHDAWVVVAPSGGINVWCAASGGHFSTHQVVTALKTCGIAERVTHRRVILPQLAATGALALDVFRRCRWQVAFGPVQAEDLPAYLAAGEKTDAMRRVRFGARERLEMAAAWAFPTAVLLGGLALALRPAWALPLVAGVVAMAVAVFALYDRLGSARRLVLAAASLAIAVGGTLLAGGGTGALVAAVLAPLGLTALLTFDYDGSTPIAGGSHFDDRGHRITLDAERCEGVYRCWEVCPEACFEKLGPERKVALAHDDRCIRCGACIVQCPKDALFFEDTQGNRIPPDVIRRFKLNLLGKRGRS